MPGPISSRHVLTDREVIEITDIDRFRPSLKCDLFIPSYVHSLSIATEYIYHYVLSRFPESFFNTIHVVGKHAFEDFRRFDKGDFAKRETPSVALAYTLNYDFNDNNLDWNWLSTNKYLKKSEWQRSFFKCPEKGLYIGMDLEAMLINYNFRFKLGTRAQQLDVYNRIRKVFRLGCTETNDIDCDFHLDRDMMYKLAVEAGFNVDPTTKEVLDPWNFTRFLNAHSQMPVMYKLRMINQKYEYFLRMRNLPVHLDFQNPLDVDDGNLSGMMHTDFNIEFQITMRFPSPRTFALYNEGKWVHQVEVEKNEGITVFSMKLFDIPEVNYKGWPMYGHSNYMADEGEKIVEKIEIGELFKAPVDVKVGTSLDDLITDSLNQFISPDSFIEIAVYTNDISLDGRGRLPITMDWENRTIILPQGTPDSYFYIAIYIDRNYINDKVIELTDANNNRIVSSKIESEKAIEQATRECYDQEHVKEEFKSPSTNFPKYKSKKARYIVNR